MSLIVCLASLTITIAYQALLVTVCLHPTLRKKYLEDTSTRGYLYPEITKVARTYQPVKQYDNQYLGV